MALRIDERQASPGLQQRLCATSAVTKSFSTAAHVVNVWRPGAVIDSRHLGDLVEGVGEELKARRDQQTDDYIHDRLKPIQQQPQAVVVEVDGGRVRVRETTQGKGAGVHGKQWRESKVARLETVQSPSFDSDPCPLPSIGVLNAKRAERLAEALEGAANPTDEEKDAIAAAVETDDPAADRWQPKPLVRTCVATMENADAFGWMVAAEAHRRNFQSAAKQAFVADGLAYNWNLQSRHFPDYVPILDFIHVMTYVIRAVKAMASDESEIDRRYRSAVTACWQGRVGEVVNELDAWLAQSGVAEKLPDDDPRRPVQKTRNYLDNNRSRMDYPRYRQEGLPITSSLIESLVKEYNFRVKGTEKFWNEQGVESMLQIVSAHLSDLTVGLDAHFRRRTGHPWRRRSTKLPATPYAAAA